MRKQGTKTIRTLSQVYLIINNINRLNNHAKYIILFCLLIFLASPVLSWANGYKFLIQKQFMVNGNLHSVAVVENVIPGGVAGFHHIIGERDVVLTGDNWWFLADALQHKGINPGWDYFTDITIENIETHPFLVKIKLLCRWESGKLSEYTIRFNGLSAEVEGAYPRESAKPLTRRVPGSIQSLAERVTKAIEPRNSIVRSFAVSLAKRYPGPYNVGQICAIYEYLRYHWKYVNDPRGFDYFAPASESIKVGLAGDCDDFAILMASLIEAIGGTSRVVLALNRNGPSHAYAEVFISRNPNEAKRIINRLSLVYTRDHLYEIFINWLKSRNFLYHYHRDLTGCWLNLDWSSTHPGGPFFQADSEIAVFPNGRSLKLK